ncbi:MAG TPA: GDP-mannose 4,6-dehydratase [Casimicrobiaceae bacterium]|jgi:GDPmannose 4,6-dehydratase
MAGEPSAIVTGITGQDGAYLAQFLLARGYRVHGTYRRTSSSNFWRLESLGVHDHPNFSLVEYDLIDAAAAVRLIDRARPREIYNLAAQSFVAVSFDQPGTTTMVNALGPLYLLEAIRSVDPSIRFYQASTSEMFGKVRATPQDEDTPFHPRSPYGVAKLYAHWATINYRESRGMHAVSGILFNHESPLRGREFVTRKITLGVARIKRGATEPLMLGNLDARRDWGYAPEYVDGMWRMLQAPTPDTWVLATGRTESVRRFTEIAFAAVGIAIEWRGRGEDETGVDTSSGRTLVRIDPTFHRPAEVEVLMGDPSKAKRELGWSASTPLERICAEMVEADLVRLERGLPY